MTPIEEIIDAVIMNNSAAVQDNLVQAGELSDGLPQLNDADLKSVIAERVYNSESDAAAQSFLERVTAIQPVEGQPGYATLVKYSNMQSGVSNSCKSLKNIKFEFNWFSGFCRLLLAILVYRLVIKLISKI